MAKNEKCIVTGPGKENAKAVVGSMPTTKKGSPKGTAKIHTPATSLSPKKGK